MNAGDNEQVEAGLLPYDAFYRGAVTRLMRYTNGCCRRRERELTETAKNTTTSAQGQALSHGISFGEALRVWARVAALSFGGPAGQIAMMHRIIVEEKRWIGETRFLHALNYCTLLPGPEAQQLAIYIGWLMHKTKGGLVAGALFVLPGAVAIMVLSWIYALFGNVGAVQALFFGLKAAVLAIVLEAVLRIGRRALRNSAMIALAAGAFIALSCSAPPSHWSSSLRVSSALSAVEPAGLPFRRATDTEKSAAGKSLISRPRLAKRFRPMHAPQSVGRSRLPVSLSFCGSLRCLHLPRFLAQAMSLPTSRSSFRRWRWSPLAAPMRFSPMSLNKPSSTIIG